MHMTSLAEARRLCQQLGQLFPPGLSQAAKAQAITHPDGTTLEAAFVTAWKQHGTPDVEWKREYQFLPGRRFRFDFALPEPLKIAVEAEGRNHSKAWTYRKDISKYNVAACEGWAILRCTSEMLTQDPAGFVALVVQTIQQRQKEQKTS